MVHLQTTKGLDIPIKGKPSGSIRPLVLSGEASAASAPSLIALDLKPFQDIKFSLLVKVGDIVTIGQPLVVDKATPGRVFVSPAAGLIKDICRGNKRVLLSIIIEVAKEEDYFSHPTLNLESTNRQELTEVLKGAGIFSIIRARPFGTLADPSKPPRSIFVKAVESAPFAPPAELHVLDREKEFQLGLDALCKLTDGPVHLVYSSTSTSKAFTDAKRVQKHTCEGPHPVANPSFHIQQIDPITSADANVWTIDARDVVSIGHLLSTGHTYIDRVISIAGPGITPSRTGFFKVRNGYPVSMLVAGRVEKGWMRLISGDPLMGLKVEPQDFLGFNDYVFSVIPENTDREFLHFFRLGTDKYSFSRAYLTGHLDNTEREYDFTTNQHGEHRAFIDGSLYDKVMPLSIPTMLLVKAVMAEDYDLAEQLGLLEVVSEDFALPTFVCPSKMEMTDIIKKGLKNYAKETTV